jgi:hypothetical protein
MEKHEMCKPSLTNNDIAHALIITSIAKFAAEYDERMLNSSFYCDIEDMEIEKDEMIPHWQIFPSQSEPLIVKNKSWLETYYFGNKPITRRNYLTKYFRLSEIHGD